MGRSIKWRNSDQIYLYTIPFLDKRLIIGVCGNVYVTVPRDVRDMDEKEGGCAVYELIETLKGASMCLYIYISTAESRYSMFFSNSRKGNIMQN